MKKFRTKTEQLELLKQIEIIGDTREQVNYHIRDYLKGRNIPYIKRKLDVGDYSCQVEGITFENAITIERKANIDEIAGNFTAQRARFENEFLRAKAKDTKVYLLIENCSWQDIASHNYISKMEPKSLIASLLSWQIRYDLNIIFCQQEQSPEIIYGLLYYFVREQI